MTDPIDIKSIKKILFLRYDRIGDMIVTTPIFRILKFNNPNIYIGVFASKKNAEIIRHNLYVDSIYILHNRWWLLIKEILKAGKEEYDVVINFIFNRTTSAGILANLIAPRGVKIGQGDDKYQFYFNRLLHLSRSSEHMVDTLVSIIQNIFRVKVPQELLHYDIAIDTHTDKTIYEFLQQNGAQPMKNSKRFKVIAFNLSATDLVRRISSDQAINIAHFVNNIMNFCTVLICDPKDTEMIHVSEVIQQKTHCLRFSSNGSSPLLSIAALIKYSLMVITPDTSIIHFASAMNTPVIGLFTQLQGMHEWLPYGVPNRLVIAPVGEPVSSIELSTITREIKSFINSLIRDTV